MHVLEFRHSLRSNDVVATPPKGGSLVVQNLLSCWRFVKVESTGSSFALSNIGIRNS